MQALRAVSTVITAEKNQTSVPGFDFFALDKERSELKHSAYKEITDTEKNSRYNYSKK